MKRPRDLHGLSRRQFLSTITGAAAISLLALDRKAIADSKPFDNLIQDYQGRICYNENPLGPSPAAKLAIMNEVNLTHRYPDWYSESLVADIASRFDVSSSNVICGSGATEILRLCAMVFSRSGVNVVSPNPTYSQFPTDAALFGAQVRYVSLDGNYRVNLQGLANQVNSTTTAVCITNPNNPTGTIVDDGALVSFVNSLPSGVTTIIDEAYLEYISDSSYQTAIEMVRQGKNVIVVKTFSKVYGLAGARIGYAVSSSSNINAMKRYQYIATLSRHSLEAARAALDDSNHVAATVDLATQMKTYCYREFDRMGLTFIPSQASFFMVDVGRDAEPVRALLASNGVYVRTGWGMPHHLRVSTGSRQDMEKFLLTLDDILQGTPPGVSPASISTTELYQAAPNPFNSSTTIRIYLPQAQDTSLEIFDIQGRLVTTLVNGILGPGEHSFIWNGTGQSGSVATGAYFYRLVSGGNSIVRRMLMIK